MGTIFEARLFLIFESRGKDKRKRHYLRKSLSRKYGALLMVHQMADVRARCCLSPNFPSLTSAHPVSMLVVLVAVATLELQLWLSAMFMGKATRPSGQFDHVPAIVENPHSVFANISHAHMSFSDAALIVR